MDEIEINASVPNKPMNASLPNGKDSISNFREYTGYDHSNYLIPPISRESVEIALTVTVKAHVLSTNTSQLSKRVSEIEALSKSTIFVKDVATSDNSKTLDIRGTRQQLLSVIDALHHGPHHTDSDISEQIALILLKVPPEMVGCVIGKAGKNIKSIKESTKAAIKVERITVMDEQSQIQTVRITGGIEEVLDAHQKVCESLRSFDPKKSRKIRESHESASGINAGVRVAQFGGSPTTELPVSIQTSFIIQRPSSNGMTTASTHMCTEGVCLGSHDVPPIVVLQSDGTYHPAPVIYQALPSSSSLGRDGSSQGSKSSSSVAVLPDVLPPEETKNH